jgi:type III secretion protein J
MESMQIMKIMKTMKAAKNRWCRVVLLLACAVLLAGCDQVELYSDLDESDANDMQAILLGQGIDCDKIVGKEKRCALKVAKSRLAAAVQILNGYGYPREKYADMGDIFKKQGLVSSPQEDRIRFIYALSQEVAETISQIEGVVNARVHIVLPENDPLSEYFQPSSASVFIKYRQTMDIQKFIHPIKQLVVNSIEGLNYDKVSIVPFPCSVVSAAALEYTRIMGIEVNSTYVARFQLLVYGLIFFLVVLVCACAFLLWQRRAARPAADPSKGRQAAGDVLAV